MEPDRGKASDTFINPKANGSWMVARWPARSSLPRK